MKIALAKTPATYANWYKQPVLGLTYLSAVLKKQGHQVRIFDAYYHGWSLPQTIEAIVEYRPDLLGLTAMTHEVETAAQLAAAVKKALPIPAVLGGCHVTALPGQTLAEFDSFDYGAVGEGEQTAAELAAALEADRRPDLGRIRGLVYREQNQIHLNEPRPFMDQADLDALPRPDFQAYYTDPQALRGRDKYYLLFSSRGCPYQCAFCMQVLGRKVRRRSADLILAEMESAMSDFGAHTFNFADEIFLFNDSKTRLLLEAMIRHPWPRPIRWTALTRANHVTAELIALAKRAGCVHLEMGVESGDNTILQNTRKGITVEQVREAVRIIQKENLPLAAYFILGHPGETEETIRKTADLAVSLNPRSIAVGLMVPYPGTQIYEYAKNGQFGYKLLSSHWSDFDKYGGRTLEIEGLPYEVLARWQQKIYLSFYLKNFRFLDFLSFFWKRRNAVFYLIKKRIRGLLKGFARCIV